MQRIHRLKHIYIVYKIVEDLTRSWTLIRNLSSFSWQWTTSYQLFFSNFKLNKYFNSVHFRSDQFTLCLENSTFLTTVRHWLRDTELWGLFVTLQVIFHGIGLPLPSQNKSLLAWLPSIWVAGCCSFPRQSNLDLSSQHFHFALLQSWKYVIPLLGQNRSTNVPIEIREVFSFRINQSSVDFAPLLFDR